MLQIEKIQLQELLSFVASDRFLQLKNKPISSLRVASYLNNPNRKSTDVVLYMAFENDELIGYRTIWRDVFFINNEAKSFGWLSGNWVHKEHRRKGVSTQLFNEVVKDWKGELMYTNYAEASKLVYDKTQDFQQVKSLQGTRFYTRFSLADILPPKKKVFAQTKFLWKFTDALGNIAVDLKSSFSTRKVNSLTTKKNEAFSEDLIDFINTQNKEELFKRNSKIFNWVRNFPWVTTSNQSKKEAENYHFSAYASNFENDYFSFYNSENRLIGFVWVSIKNKHLKIPYLYVKDGYLEEVTSFIAQKITQEKVKTVLVYNEKLQKIMNEELSFITKKPFYQNYFATKKLVTTYPEIQEKPCQSGDGDVLFT